MSIVKIENDQWVKSYVLDAVTVITVRLFEYLF